MNVRRGSARLKPPEGGAQEVRMNARMRGSYVVIPSPSGRHIGRKADVHG